MTKGGSLVPLSFISHYNHAIQQREDMATRYLWAGVYRQSGKLDL